MTDVRAITIDDPVLSKDTPPLKDNETPAAAAEDALPKKSEEEIAAERAALVAAIEADIEKRKQRAERFGMPFQLTDLDARRPGVRPRPGSPCPGRRGGGGEPKEALEGRARR